MTMTNHVVTFYLPVMNYEFWMMLSPEDQKMMKDAIQEAFVFQQGITSKEESEQIEAMRAAGLEINELDPAAKQKIVEKTKSIREKYRSKIGADIYDAWSAQANAAI